MSELIWLPRVKAALAGGPLPSNRAFGYFFLVVGFDALQLAMLDARAHQPGPYTAFSVWASFAAGAVFIPLAYLVNGGSRGVDFFSRYFALCAVVGIWLAGPLQLLLAVPRWFELAPGPLYAPALVLALALFPRPFLPLPLPSPAPRAGAPSLCSWLLARARARPP